MISSRLTRFSWDIVDGLTGFDHDETKDRSLSPRLQSGMTDDVSFDEVHDIF